MVTNIGLIYFLIFSFKNKKKKKNERKLFCANVDEWAPWRRTVTQAITVLYLKGHDCDSARGVI